MNEEEDRVPKDPRKVNLRVETINVCIILFEDIGLKEKKKKTIWGIFGNTGLKGDYLELFTICQIPSVFSLSILATLQKKKIRYGLSVAVLLFHIRWN